MNTTETQQQLVSLINERLDKLDLPEQPRSLYEPVRYTIALGGKRMRPCLTLLACGLCGGDVREAVPAATAIELLHNFTLIHDDIMDAADQRRGQPSVVKKWSASTAILSGDVTFAEAIKQLQYYGESDRYTKEQYRSIYDSFIECLVTVCEGQAYDLEFETSEKVTLEEYLGMIKGKTAALLSGALSIGGIIAGTGKEERSLLYQVGQDAGIAFQIQDDLLDAVADPETFGKKRGGDIAEGKKTYLSIVSLERGSHEQKQKLRAILASTQNTDAEINQAIEFYRELGAVDEARKEIENYYGKAIEHLQLFADNEYSRQLETFFSTLIQRVY